MLKCNCIHKVGGYMDMTKIYEVSEFNDALTKDILKEVYDILKDRGYNPINQIIGYIMSGDPGYITSYKDARNKMLSLERSKIIEVLLKELIKCDI